MSRKNILAQGLAETLSTTRDAYTQTTLIDLFGGINPTARKQRALYQAGSGLVDIAVALLKASKK